MSLVTRTICLRTSGDCSNQPLKRRLGTVDLGRVKKPNAVGERLLENTVLPSHRPLFENGDLEAGLPQFPRHERCSGLGRLLLLRMRPRCNARRPGRCRCERSGLEKRATIGPIHFVMAHLDRLLITKVWNARLPDLVAFRSLEKSQRARVPSRCHGPNSPNAHCNHSDLPRAMDRP